MGLQTLGLLSGATLSATGGTALSFTPASGAQVNQVYLADASEADFRLRKFIQAKAAVPVAQRNGTFSKDRRNVTLNIPIYDSVSGVYEPIVFRIERVAPAFTSASDLAAATNLAGQLCFDADMSAFWASGSYA